MRRFILAREEGGEIELMSRAQLMAAIDAMDSPPNFVGIVWRSWKVRYPDYWYGPNRWARSHQGVGFDSYLAQKYRGQIGPWCRFPARLGNSTDIRGKVKRRAQDAALAAIVARLCKRFGI